MKQIIFNIEQNNLANIVFLFLNSSDIRKSLGNFLDQNYGDNVEIEINEEKQIFTFRERDRGDRISIPDNLLPSYSEHLMADLIRSQQMRTTTPRRLFSRPGQEGEQLSAQAMSTLIDAAFPTDQEDNT